jgi:hypothetical protein
VVHSYHYKADIHMTLLVSCRGCHILGCWGLLLDLHGLCVCRLLNASKRVVLWRGHALLPCKADLFMTLPVSGGWKVFYEVLANCILCA